MSKPKRVKGPALPGQSPAAPTEQQVDQQRAAEAAAEELRRDRKRGAVSNMLTGEAGLSNLGGVSSKMLLG